MTCSSSSRFSFYRDDCIRKYHPESVLPLVSVHIIMGACCSRCCNSSDSEEGNGDVSAAELEMQAQADLKSLCVVRGMSAPTVEIEDRTKVCSFRSP